MDEPEDYYVFYVMILGISEDLFWFADWSFVGCVADNKNAYDAWLGHERKRVIEKEKKR